MVILLLILKAFDVDIYELMIFDIPIIYLFYFAYCISHCVVNWGNMQNINTPIYFIILSDTHSVQAKKKEKKEVVYTKRLICIGCYQNNNQ